jgi:hypothetical protein
MKNEEKDLLPRTKMFARRIIRLYVSLSKTRVGCHFYHHSQESARSHMNRFFIFHFSFFISRP